MAFDLGSIIAHVKADLTDFKSGMSQAKDEVNGFKGHLAGMADGLRDFATQASIMSAAVAAGFTVIAKTAIDSSAKFEQNRIAFETMLGSAKEAQKLLAEISQFAKTTPFELPQLVEASQRLLAYNFSAKEIIPTMTMLGNISAGVGTEKLPQLILAFGQVKAATHLTGMELRQFSEAGVPLLQALVDQANKAGGSWVTVGGSSKKAAVDVGELNDKLNIARQRLSEATANGKTHKSTLMSLQNTVQNLEQSIAKANGTVAAGTKVWSTNKTTVKEMIDQISNGDVSFEQVEKALGGMTNEGGKFFNLMDKQSHTFGGVMSNIKDQIGITLRAIMGLDTSGNIAEGSIFAQMKTAAEGLMTFLQTNGPAIQSFVQGAFQKLGAVFSTLSTVLAPVGEWMMAHKEVVSKFLLGMAGGLAAVLAVAPLVLIAMNPFVLIMTAIAVAAGLLYTAWSTNFLGIQTVTMTIFNAIRDFMKTNGDEIMMVLKAVWDIVTGIIQIALALIMAIVTPFLDEFARFWKQHGEGIIEGTRGVWNLIKGIIEVTLGIIQAIIGFVTNAIKGNWDEAWQAVFNGTALFIKGMENIINGIVGFIKGWGGSLINALVSPFRDAWNQISDFINKIKDGLDFTKRHSPSVLDIVNRGVDLVNKSLSGLDYGLDVNPHASFIGAPSSSNSVIASVQISMDGAIIADEASAMRMSEQIGDNILGKLKTQLRI